MRLHIAHRTSYRYDSPLPYALQQLRMFPKDSAGQKVISWKTEVDGGKRQVEFFDQHNNHVELFSFDEGQSDVFVHCEGIVETSDTAGTLGQHGGFAPLWYFRRETDFTRPGPAIRRLVRQFDAQDKSDSAVARLHALLTLVRDTVRYEIGATHSLTAAEDALVAGHGVCQDHAHIFIAAARLLRFPARYVSGYLLIDGQVEQDAGHGWAEAHVDGLGWVGFDVSNGISPDQRYVRVATGLDFREAAPIAGLTFGADNEAMSVSLQVQEQSQN